MWCHIFRQVSDVCPSVMLKKANGLMCAFFAGICALSERINFQSEHVLAFFFPPLTDKSFALLESDTPPSKTVMTRASDALCKVLPWH